MKGYFFDFSYGEWYEDMDPLIKYFDYLNDSDIVNIRFPKTTYFTLFQFINNTSNLLSTEDLHKILENTPFSEIDYKNILKKIKRFLKLGLIKKSKPEKMPERPNVIYYKVTSAGLVYLLSKMNDYQMNHYEKFSRQKFSINNFVKYLEDDFFRFFLYPIMDINSAKNIKSNWITNDLLEYFIKVSKLIIKQLEIDKKNLEHTKPYLYWSCFLKCDPNNKLNSNTKIVNYFLFELKRSPILYWLKENEKYVNFEKINKLTVKFSSKEHKLVLKIDEETKKLKIEYNDKEVGYYKIRKEYQDFLIFSNPLYDQSDLFTTPYQITDFSRELRSFIEDLGFSILESIRRKQFHSLDNEFIILKSIYEENFDYNKELDYQEEKKIDQDLKILAEDTKMTKLLEEMNRNYNEMYSDFCKYKKNEYY